MSRARYPYDAARELKLWKSCFTLLKGMRGQERGDIDAFVDLVVRVSHLLATFPEIRELDINPVRVFGEGSGVMALDARMRLC